MDRIIPTPHPDPWVNLPHAYVTATAAALMTSRLHLGDSWIDPKNPRDATLTYRMDASRKHSDGLFALVWDEETGWRTGRFVTGRQGVRTELAGVRYLGGGVLPEPADVGRRLHGGLAAEHTVYRSRGTARDGLDDAVRAWSLPAA